jgi:hypothetical protein
MSSVKLQADFNGLFGDVLCLSHKDSEVDQEGRTVILRSAMSVTAFDEDQDKDGNRVYVVASGTVEPSPDWLQCKGSRWVLRIDKRGVRHESGLREANA